MSDKQVQFSDVLNVLDEWVKQQRIKNLQSMQFSYRLGDDMTIAVQVSRTSGGGEEKK